jgi:hypothetical protein
MTIFIICAAISIVGTILYLLQVGATCSLIKKKPHCVGADDTAGCETNFLPPISILKPL